MHKIDYGRKYGALPIHILDLDDEHLEQFAEFALIEPRPNCLECNHPRYVKGRPFTCSKSSITNQDWNKMQMEKI